MCQCCERCSPVQRMVAGMILAAVSFVAAGFLQIPIDVSHMFLLYCCYQLVNSSANCNVCFVCLEEIELGRFLSLVVI